MISPESPDLGQRQGNWRRSGLNGCPRSGLKLSPDLPRIYEKVRRFESVQVPEVRRPARRPPLSHAARWPRRLCITSNHPTLRRSRLLTSLVLGLRRDGFDIISSLSADYNSELRVQPHHPINRATTTAGACQPRPCLIARVMCLQSIALSCTLPIS